VKARRRAKGPAVVGLVVIGLVTGRSLAADGLPDAAVRGVIQDVAGRALQGVEIVALGWLPGAPPLAATRSDSDGRFLLRLADPGVYRIAALKQGYRTYLATVDTLVATSLEVLLQPGSVEREAMDDAPVAEDASWVLRLPRRSVLREVGPVEYLRSDLTEALEQDRPGRFWLADPVGLRLEQLFLVGGSARREADAGPALDGSETRMRLASVFGTRGNLRVRGDRERVSGRPPEPVSALATLRESSFLDLDLSYNTSRDANLAIRAFYGERDMEAPGFAEPAGRSLDQTHQSWGYDASWSTQLDPASRLSVEVDYRDAATRVREQLLDQGPGGAWARSRRGLLNRSMGTEGTFETVPRERHQLRVGFRAQFAEHPAYRGAEDAPIPVAWPAAGRWSVRLNAEDRWSVATPLTLTYGLGYSHAIAEGHSSLIVPRIGGSWSAESVSARLVLSYHAAVVWDDPEAGLPVPRSFRPQRPAGYEAEVELPLRDTLRIGASTSYAPIQPESPAIDDRWELGAVEAWPRYWTDGNLAAGRSSVTLTHQSRQATTRLRFARGYAEGRLTLFPSTSLPSRLLAEGRLDYLEGSLGVHVAPSGTDFVVEFLDMRESSARPAGGEQTVEFRVIQDLFRLHGADCSWRLLLSARGASVRPGAGESSVEGTTLQGPERTPLSQFRAGLSVTF
jgi:hypothetical protein